MKTLPTLQPGDSVEIIAPASRCTDQQLLAMKSLFASWQLKCVVADDIFGEDSFCANTDEMRFHHLKNALHNPETKAIICARGGYGSMRLIPQLMQLAPPEKVKIFVGMSDVTALQLFLQQNWQWPVIHGASSPDRFSQESIAALKSILFAEVKEIHFHHLQALNKLAENKQTINASVSGGNLCLLQTSIGTKWQLDSRDKIILMEEISERGYRIDRMLEQLTQANIFKGARAIIFADFIKGEEPDGSSKIQFVLERFAKRCDVPVLRIQGIGHDYINFPVPFGTAATLQFGDEIKLICKR